MHQVRADLERLRHIVDSSWAQDGHCLLICMQDIYPLELSPQFAHPPQRDMVRALGFLSFGGMFSWNDRADRTKAEVLDLIDGALQGA